MQNNKKILTGNLCNCLTHACFNFLNEHYQLYNFSEYDSLTTRGLLYGCKTKEEFVLKINNFLESSGLKIEKDCSSKILKNNQWRVALYFDEIKIGKNDFLRDFHFMLQEKDGTWSSKEGLSPKVNFLNELPENYDDYYKLYNTFILKNPHAETLEK